MTDRSCLPKIKPAAREQGDAARMSLDFQSVGLRLHSGSPWKTFLCLRFFNRKVSSSSVPPGEAMRSHV